MGTLVFCVILPFPSECDMILPMLPINGKRLVPRHRQGRFFAP